MQNTTRIGIIGGSFNPVHIAHLIIAERFREEMGLGHVYFVPAFVSPFKTSERFYKGATAEQRCQMVRLAIATNAFFSVNESEIQRKEVSYTIDTVNYFLEQFPNANIYLLIGADQARDFQKWKHWQEILMKVQLCIARRPGYLSDEDERKILSMLRVGEKLPRWLEAPLMEISATEIRRRVSEGRSIRYMVPEAVENYILSEKLYAEL